MDSSTTYVRITSPKNRIKMDEEKEWMIEIIIIPSRKIESGQNFFYSWPKILDVIQLCF